MISSFPLISYLALLSLQFFYTESFAFVQRINERPLSVRSYSPNDISIFRNRKRCRDASHISFAVSDTLANVFPLLAGSIAGAIGVGIAYPADTIKTKSQAYAFKTGKSLGLFSMTKLIIQDEGIKGFYGGVKGVMLGQSLIKAVAFASNTWALNLITQSNLPSQQPSIMDLALAAATSGFIASFFVNPVERVKILMQADKTGEYANEIDCAIKVTKQDGFFGLISRGLDATIAREVPGYGLYFVVYSLLKRSALTNIFGHFAPLVCGALAGCMSWIPVYPFDVIKTSMQNTEGFSRSREEQSGSISDSSSSSSSSMLSTAIELQKKGGWGVFYDGITPKLIRAAINHAVTFYVYDLILQSAHISVAIDID